MSLIEKVCVSPRKRKWKACTSATAKHAARTHHETWTCDPDEKCADAMRPYSPTAPSNSTAASALTGHNERGRASSIRFLRSDDRSSSKEIHIVREGHIASL